MLFHYGAMDRGVWEDGEVTGVSRVSLSIFVEDQEVSYCPMKNDKTLLILSPDDPLQRSIARDLGLGSWVEFKNAATSN